MAKTVADAETTLLKTLVRQRHLTVKETLGLLDERARRMGEGGYALSERQLRRWLSGNVGSPAELRPANVRVVEAEFRCSIEALLAPGESGTQDQRSQSVGEEARKLRTGEFIEWVAEHSGLSYEDAYATVAEGVETTEALSPATRAAWDHYRSRVGRARLADAVAAYYGDPAGLYRVRVGQSIISLSVLADEHRVGLQVPLGGAEELCTPADDVFPIRLSEVKPERPWIVSPWQR